MFGFKFLGRAKTPHNKNTAEMAAVRMTSPKEVLLPLSQHIGAPATPTVKVGDTVKIGQLIAEPTGFVSSPVHASVSGKVVKIEEYLNPAGKTVPAIRIESDGLMEVYEGITPPEVSDLDSLLAAVRASGLVGLGGAGFPTAVKLNAAKNGPIHTVVINGAECEPFLTSDTRTMIDDSAYVYEGIELLDKYLPNVERFIFGIENNKPKCIEEIARIFQDNEKVSVNPLPSLYPQGAEKVIVKNTTGLVIPEGKLPADVGVIVINVTTLAFMAKYVKTGMPLVERCVTFDGSATAHPMNIIVPIGTSIREIADFAGGFDEPVGKVLFGGPMMGSAAANLDEPIVKTTNGITVINTKDSVDKEATACIHCGRCVEICPMSLNPTAFEKALKVENTEDRMARLDDGRVNLCMECGSCSFVCPAQRPLIQSIRLGKTALRTYKAHQANLK